MNLKYACPSCGTPLGYQGLCWKCKCEQERQAEHGGSIPLTCSKTKSSESLDFKGFSEFFMFLKRKLQVHKTAYF